MKTLDLPYSKLHCLKSLVLCFTFLFSTCIFAQSSIGKNSQEALKPIVKYYPFYDGIQMVEIDYLTAHQNRINRLEQEQPRALSWSSVLGAPPENVYIFRNEFSVRVKQYGRVTGKVKIKSVGKSKDLIRPHSHFSHRLGTSYGLSHIQTRCYPYYLMGRSEEQTSGLIDSLGNLALDQEYHQIYANLEGSIIVARKGNTYELRDQNLLLKYATNTYTLSISQNHAAVSFCKGDTCGLKDKNGKTIVPCKYSIIWPFNAAGLAKVRNPNYLEGFVDSTGKEVIECKYQNFGKFTEGLIGARLNGKRGFIDTHGKTVIPFNYDHAFWFVDGLARVSVKKEGEYHFGYIDRQGNEVIPLIYANATDFKDGIAEVRTDFEGPILMTTRTISKGEKAKRKGHWVRIDQQGNILKD